MLKPQEIAADPHSEPRREITSSQSAAPELALLLMETIREYETRRLARCFGESGLKVAGLLEGAPMREMLESRGLADVAGFATIFEAAGNAALQVYFHQFEDCTFAEERNQKQKEESQARWSRWRETHHEAERACATIRSALLGNLQQGANSVIS